MNQDLKYASEAIMQIAQQAIKSIELLYADVQTNHNPEPNLGPPNTSNYESPNETDRVPTGPPIMQIHKRDRPQKIDENLHDLNI